MKFLEELPSNLDLHRGGMNNYLPEEPGYAWDPGSP